MASKHVDGLVVGNAASGTPFRKRFREIRKMEPCTVQTFVHSWERVKGMVMVRG
jgi:hypothetical protein